MSDVQETVTRLVRQIAKSLDRDEGLDSANVREARSLAIKGAALAVRNHGQDLPATAAFVKIALLLGADKSDLAASLNVTPEWVDDLAS